MYDCVNIGNIFPTRDGTANSYYMCNKINSIEKTEHFYNQLEVAIDNDTTFMISSKAGESEMSIQSYFEQMLS